MYSTYTPPTHTKKHGWSDKNGTDTNIDDLVYIYICFYDLLHHEIIEWVCEAI